ncbi:MAG: hypothetical protein HC929_22525, partial [Leptolyngbyaceae cyanobacterium SM2_5_2]|nr:hypothetical protein [Leptolyngbyaceae cyanobacterium SM2_5_2]
PQPSTPVPQAPTQAPANPTAQLPNTLVNQWEPMSNVLLTFGTMTVTPSEVTWSSGQRSAYTLISTDGGFLLKLETSPKFYDTPNPFIKLIPETNEAGAITSIEGRLLRQRSPASKRRIHYVRLILCQLSRSQESGVRRDDTSAFWLLPPRRKNESSLTPSLHWGLEFLKIVRILS